MIVLPSIYPEWTEACLATCKIQPVYLVDNTEVNIGVASSWNLGIRRMIAYDHDWLVILSAGVRFGESGGRDFMEYLMGSDDIAVESQLGWHLIAFSRELIEKVGYFDENFYPAYYEDLDYAWRVKLAYDLTPPYWPKVEVDATLAGVAHGVKKAGVRVDSEKLEAYFEKKWGKRPADLRLDGYTEPFNGGEPCFP
jgi:hypothetical protein